MFFLLHKNKSENMYLLPDLSLGASFTSVISLSQAGVGKYPNCSSWKI